jgi:hypothetical protein
MTKGSKKSPHRSEMLTPMRNIQLTMGYWLYTIWVYIVGYQTVGEFVSPGLSDTFTTDGQYDSDKWQTKMWFHHPYVESSLPLEVIDGIVGFYVSSLFSLSPSSLSFTPHPQKWQQNTSTPFPSPLRLWQIVVVSTTTSPSRPSASLLNPCLLPFAFFCNYPECISLAEHDHQMHCIIKNFYSQKLNVNYCAN